MDRDILKYSNFIFHNSEKARFRSPLGARPAGSRVTLRLYCGSVRPNGVHVVLFGENYEQKAEMNGVEGWWEATLTLPEQAGAYWYYFVLRLDENTAYFGCKGGKTSGDGELYSYRPVCFQLTVHEKDFKTPDGYKRAVLYQIFPDRFAKSSKNCAKAGLEYHHSMGRKGYLHGSFDESPAYLPMPGEEYYSPCDYFGGDLYGIEQSLPYLSELGVTVIYLNPIFEADSNHRYNTADYRRIDPMLGTNEDFKKLCRSAEKFGIKIILDGVFSHTGSDSVYFNKTGKYPEPGAYQGPKSRFYSWYEFFEFPNSYRSWWGFDTLPEVQEEDPEWQDFMISGEDSVIKAWLEAGADGYRLDVADELPDDVIEKIRQAIKEHNPEHFLLGEVWEDATTKQSYGKHRTYAYGKGLDSVMNYPFRNEVVNFLLGHTDAKQLIQFFAGQALNYPKEMYYCLMNLLSSHDIERVRTVLGTKVNASELSREQQGSFVILPEQDRHGGVMQRLAVLLQYTLPGMPSVYYGDETGLNGLRDPFNRGPFAIRDQTIGYHYGILAKIRRSADALMTGHVSFFAYGDHIAGVVRFILDGKDAFGKPAENGVFVSIVNRSNEKIQMVLDLYHLETCIDEEQLRLLRNSGLKQGMCLLTGKAVEIIDGLLTVEVFEESGMLLKIY